MERNGEVLGLESIIATARGVGLELSDSATAFELISGYFSFYPGRVECFVGNERVRPQSGHFYGGWVTDEIVGPWKGERGTESW